MTSTTNGTTTTSSSSSNTNGIGGINTIQLPPTTALVIGLCCILYCVQVIFDIPIHNLTLCPKNVLYYNEYYRIISNCLFHGSIMHIGMNLLSGYPLLQVLEKQYGTIRLLLIIIWSILLTSCIYIIIATLLSILFHYTKYMYQHSIGFSGILFHLLVLECSSSNLTQRSIFGFVTVSTIYYPWILLVLIQFLMPNVSFLGHLSGIVVGTLQCYTKLYTSILLPSDSYLTNIDNYILSTLLSSSLSRGNTMTTFRETYVRTTPTPNDTTTGNSTSNIRSNFHRIIQTIRTKLYNGIDTIYVTVFGRGHTMNSNILLFTTTNNNTNHNRRDVPSGINDNDDITQLTTPLTSSTTTKSSPNNNSNGMKSSIQDINNNNDDIDRMLV